MIPIVVAGVGIITAIAAGVTLGFMEDGAELAMTSKKIMVVQNAKGSESLDVQLKDADLVIRNEGSSPSSILAIKTVDEIDGEQIHSYKTTLDPSNSVTVSGNYSDKNVYVITDLANVFSLELDVHSNSALSGSVGSHMKIIQNSVSGSIISGKGQQPGIENAVRPYYVAQQTDNYVFVIDDGGQSKRILLPTFYGTYHYTGHGVERQYEPNVLSYVNKSVVGSAKAGFNYNHLIFFGVGQIHAEIDSQLINQTMRLSGIIPKDSMIEIVGKLNESSSQTETVLRVSANPEVVSMQSNHVTNLEAAFDNKSTTYATVKSNQKEVIFDFGAFSLRNIESLNIGLGYHNGYWVPLCLYVDDGGSYKKITQLNVYYQTNNVINVNYEGIFRNLKLTSCDIYHYVPRVNIHEVSTSFAPNSANVVIDASENEVYYEATLTMPYSAKLVVVSNSYSNTLVRGSILDSNPPYFEVTGLAPNAPYRIERDGFTSVVSITTSDGTISLPTSKIDSNSNHSIGGALILYSNYVGHTGKIDTLVVDVTNKRTIQLPPSDDGKLVYVPYVYVRWVIPVAATINDIFVDEIAVSYLSGDYEAGSALMIPVMPGSKKISGNINGINITMQLAHIEAPARVIPIEGDAATFSKYGSDGTAVFTTAESNAVAFMVATQTGKMYAIIDMNNVGGNASFTMNSNYTGELAEAHGTYTRVFPVRSTISVGYKYYFPPPESITNMNNLTTNHADELVSALNRGQVSALVVDVDVYKNSEHIKTERIYKANSGIANVVSQVTHATYNTLSFSPNYYYNNNGYDKFNSKYQVRIEYSAVPVDHIMDVDVDIGDMVEFVVRVNLAAQGTPAPEIDQYSSGVHATSATSAYVEATVEYSNGLISAGML